MKKEKFKTLHNVFDEFTNRNIYKLITQGYIKGLIGPLSIGKESNVFTAISKDNKKVIVKIYRLETCDFNRMYDYIKYDPRFQRMTKRRREVIFMWTKREYRNILKSREANVKVPTPITFLHNILLEEFIGNDSPAPKLKDSHIEDPQEFFNNIIKNMKRLYKAKLIHADLSPFNILNHNQKPVFIDFSQATPLDNPNAQDYLKRDIKNICNFFRKHGLDIDDEAVLKKIKN